MAGQTSSWLKQLQQPTMGPFRILYSDKMPVDVRDHIAHWIQAQFSNASVYYDKQNAIDIYEHATQFLDMLVGKLRRTGAVCTNEIRTELEESADTLLRLFSDNPVPLYEELVNCLRQYQLHCNNLDAFEKAEMFEKLQQLKEMVCENENGIDNLIMEHRFLAHGISELQSLEVMLVVVEHQQAEERMFAQYQLFEQQKTVKDHLQTFSDLEFAVASGFRKAIHTTDKLHDKILNKHLRQWKTNQILAAIGASATLESDLDTIQLWCESLMEIILKMKEQILQTINIQTEGYIDLTKDPVLAQAMKDVTNLLETLVYNSCIVEHQPPQVIRMRNRFAASVRLLIGTTLCSQMKPPQVDVSIISEVQAREVHCKKKPITSAAGEILNNVGLMDYSETTKHFAVTLNKLRVNKITRMDSKQQNKSVLDEKLALLFQVRITTKHENRVVPVWALSCPIVVIVHVSQEPKSSATIIWDHIFARNVRTPFDVPALVQWNRLADVLSLKFSSSRDRQLSPEQKHFLCEKAFGSDIPFPIPKELTITWSQFCKDDLPGCSYTFWGWVYQAIKLTRDHLQDLWTHGRIYGFIQKNKAEQYLANCQPGTFLLRFSGTVLGGIIISFVHEDDIRQRQILHIEPFKTKDLSIRSLADRILDIDVLTHLYPSIPKCEAFQRRIVQNSETSRQQNYIRTELHAMLIFPPVDKSSNQTCNNNQVATLREYTCSNADDISFFDLETVTLLTQHCAEKTQVNDLFVPKVTPDIG